MEGFLASIGGRFFSRDVFELGYSIQMVSGRFLKCSSPVMI